jgi:hypothetical protein
VATKAKKSTPKKAPVKKASAKKAASKKATTGRRSLITRSDEYTQLTWVLIAIWLILIAIFLSIVIVKG